VWNKHAYVMRDALPGYAPDPDVRRLPEFNRLVESITRELFGDTAMLDVESGLLKRRKTEATTLGPGPSPVDPRSLPYYTKPTPGAPPPSPTMVVPSPPPMRRPGWADK
jgi:hypothetical protein